MLEEAFGDNVLGQMQTYEWFNLLQSSGFFIYHEV